MIALPIATGFGKKLAFYPPLPFPKAPAKGTSARQPCPSASLRSSVLGFQPCPPALGLLPGRRGGSLTLD